MLSKWLIHQNGSKSYPWDFGIKSQFFTSRCTDVKQDFLRKQGFSFIFTMQALKFPVWLICLFSPQHRVTISYHQCEISDGSILTLDPGQQFSKTKQTLFKESSRSLFLDTKLITTVHYIVR